jgi:hypothetical protein
LKCGASIAQRLETGQLDAWPSGLETRGLHALAREKAIDGLAMYAKHAAHAHGVEAAVVNQSPDRLRMYAQLVRDLANADEAWISTCRRHGLQA